MRGIAVTPEFAVADTDIDMTPEQIRSFSCLDRPRVAWSKL